MKFAIAKILEKEGYIAKAEQVTEAKFPVLKLTLSYEGNEPRIRMVRRVSKPGRRVYAKTTELPVVLANIGIAIISTPNGLMTNKEAHARRLGGEIICEIS